jgi:hypothetical protein
VRQHLNRAKTASTRSSPYLAGRKRPDNARPLYLFLNFFLEIFHLACGILPGMNEKSLQFHIEAQDYFGTLATELDLVSQDLRKRGHRTNAETLVRLRDSLMHLQQGYRIEKIAPMP